MPTKKTTDLDDGMDFDFDAFDDSSFGSDDSKPSKKMKSRSPIIEVASSAAKGSARQLRSFGFLKNVAKNALPDSYSYAADTIDSLDMERSRLFDTASKEWKKNEPLVKRAVKRLLPSGDTKLPKAFEKRLRDWVDESAPSRGNSNPDEDTIRQAMGELEMVTAQNRANERREDNAKQDVRDQIGTNRFKQNFKVWASMEARLARTNAFNEQIVFKYQKRSLELQYRQYFTLRDTQKLLATDLGAIKKYMEATVHNTALPDADKLKMSERFKNSAKDRLANIPSSIGAAFTRNFFGKLRENLEGQVKNIMSGMGDALSMADMGSDRVQMMKDMGMDVRKETGKAIGSGLVDMIGKFLGGKIKQSFHREGFTTQKGSKLSRTAMSLPDLISSWAERSSDTDTIGGQLTQLLKDLVPRKSVNRIVGGTDFADQSEPGILTKRFQRSVEEVMPEYLSRILHELTSIRTGKDPSENDRLVWNDQRNSFTSKSARRSDVHERLANNPSMTFGRERVKDMVDYLTAGRELSGEARLSFETQLMNDMLSGKSVTSSFADIHRGRGTEFIQGPHAKEISKAMRGRFKGANGRTDQVTRLELLQKMRSLQSAVPDLTGMASGMVDNGHLEDLMEEGLVTRKGDSFHLDVNALTRLQQGNVVEGKRASPYSREPSTWSMGGSDSSIMASLMDPKTDLFKPGQFDKPVISAAKLKARRYLNAKTGHVIERMAEVLDGVREGGKLVTPGEVRKLVTKNGESIEAYLERTKNNTTPTSAFGNLTDRFDKFFTKYFSNSGDRIDDFLTDVAEPKARAARRWAKSKMHTGSSKVDDFVSFVHDKAEKAESAMEETLTPGTEAHAKAKEKAEEVLKTAREKVDVATKAVADTLDEKTNGGFSEAVNQAKEAIETAESLQASGQLGKSVGGWFSGRVSILKAKLAREAKKGKRRGQFAWKHRKAIVENIKGNASEAVSSLGEKAKNKFDGVTFRDVQSAADRWKGKARDAFGTVAMVLHNGHSEPGVASGKEMVVYRGAGQDIPLLGGPTGLAVTTAAQKRPTRPSPGTGMVLYNPNNPAIRLLTHQQSFDHHTEASSNVEASLRGSHPEPSDKTAKEATAKVAETIAEAVSQAAEKSNTAEKVNSIESLITEFMKGNFERLEGVNDLIKANIVASSEGNRESVDVAEHFGYFGKAGKLTRRSLMWSLGKMWPMGKFLGRMAGKVSAIPFKMLGSGVRGLRSLATSLTREKTHLGDEPTDVFVLGEKNARLTKGGMLAGIYFNTDKEGKPTTNVTAPSMITSSTIIDADGNVILSPDDIKKGLTDILGNSIILKGLKTTLSIGGKILGGFGKFYGGAFGLLGSGMHYIAKSVRESIDNRIVQDVYVRGKPDKPVLFAAGMRNGIYLTVKSNKVVRAVNDIDGPVRDRTDKDNIVLSEEDLKDGIVDARGKPFVFKGPTLLSKILTAAGGLTGTVIKGYAKAVGSVMKASFKLMALPFKAIAGLGRGVHNLWRTGRFFGNPAMYNQVPMGDKITHRILLQIGQLLDARLPENETARRGSWQSILEEHKEEKAAKDGRADGTGKPKDSMWSKLMNLFKRKNEEDDGDDGDNGDGNGGTYVDGGDEERPKRSGTLTNGKDARGRKRGGWRRNRQARRLRRMRQKGMTGMERTGMGSRIAKEGGFLSRHNPFRRGSLLRRAGGAIGAGAGGLFARGGRLGLVGGLGRGLWRMKGGLAAMAGGMALDSYAQSHQGTTMGSIAGGASTALNVGGMALTGAQLLGYGGGIAGAVGGLGTAATAVGSGLAAVGGGILSVLSSPILLAAAAAGAAGYGIYKAVKYFKMKNSGPLRRLRLAQYGWDIDKGTGNAETLLKLENLLAPHVVYQGGSASIDFKGVKLDDIYKLFGLSHSWYNPAGWFSGDKKDKKAALLQWLSYRFRPVFLQWMGALNKIAPSVEIDDTDEKLSPEQKDLLIKQVSAISASVYQVGASPFDDDEPLITDPAVVASFVEKAKASIAKKKKDTPSKTAAGAAAAAVTAGAAKPNGIGAGGPGKPPTGQQAAIAASMAGASIAAAASASGTNKVKQANSQNFTHMYLGGKVSAFMAVRYKTYGLTDLTDDKVRALFILENAVLDKVLYNNKGNASFDEDIDFYFKEYGGYFGVSASDDQGKLRWYSWFSKRFLPTLLQFATAVKQFNKTMDPRDAEDRMAPKHLLAIANLVIASVFKGKLTSSSVWTITDSPFDDKPLNTDSKVTDENIQALKNQVKALELQEEKAKIPTTTPNGQAINKAAGQSGPANKPQAPLPPGVEAGSAAADRFASTGSVNGPVGSAIVQPGKGTGGDINKLPTPTGTGKEALMPLLQAAGKMAGVDPNLLSVFAGIESSYGANTNAQTSSAKGVFQFIDSTWKSMLAQYAGKYGIDPRTSPNDVRANTLMAAEYIKQNQAQLAKVLGRQPTDTELYLAHFLGPGGASAMLRSGGSSIAAAVNPKAAASNASIFYRRGQPLTVAQVMAGLNDKVSKFRGTTSDLNSLAGTQLAANQPNYNGGVLGTKNAASNDTSGQAPSATPVSAGASGHDLAGLTPPSPMAAVAPTAQVAGAATTDTGAAMLATQTSVAQRRGVQAARQAQLTQASGQSNWDAVSSILGDQLKAQQGILDTLQKMLVHTGALPAIAQNTESDTTEANGQGDSPALASRTNKPPQGSSDAPSVPVSMRAVTYG